MNELSAAARFLNLTAAVALAGGFGFLLLVALPAYSRTPHGARPAYLSLVRIQFRIADWCLVVLLTSTLLGLWAQTSIAGDFASGTAPGLGAMFDLLANTQFGKVWLIRTGLLVALGGMQLMRWQRKDMDSRNPLIAEFAFAALLLAAGALSGHAGAADGWMLASRISVDMLHLLSAGVWLGGLLPLWTLLRLAQRGGDAAACALAAAATQRFSGLALISFAVLIASGSYNAWNLVGGFATLFGTAYGKLLLLKLGLVLPLLGIGAMNLLGLKPRILQVAQAGKALAHLDRLARNIAVEVVLGIGILLIVAYLGITPPAAHVQPEWPFPFRWDWSGIGRIPGARTGVERGAAWLAAGGIALWCAFALRRRRVMTVTLGLGATIYAGVTILTAVSIDAYPTTYKRPDVTYQAISVAGGKRLYEDSGCAHCHGAAGYGDGPAAQTLDPKPADLTAAHANMHTAGDLFWWISHGIGRSAMPGFSERLGEEELWDLINFLRALSASERARSLEPVVGGKPWLVAPDFTYQTEAGGAQTLKDHRSKRVVLLVLLEPGDRGQRLAQLAAAMPVLRSAGLEVIVVPDPKDRLRAARRLPGPVVTEGGEEILQTYALFARSALDDGRLVTQTQVEFLVDKQGYVRARWLPAEGSAWKEMEDLLAQATFLKEEIPLVPVPEEHVH